MTTANKPPAKSAPAKQARTSAKPKRVRVRVGLLSVRLPPKLRYLAELAARKERRTLLSFVEWAVEDSLNRVRVREAGGRGDELGGCFAEEAERLWDVEPAERFARLAVFYPELLSHEEQILWKTIKDTGLMWQGGYRFGGRWTWDPEELERIVFPQIRAHWDTFRRVAAGTLAHDALPRWEAPAREVDEALDDDAPPLP
jgi:hypothetical protein